MGPELNLCVAADLATIPELQRATFGHGFLKGRRVLLTGLAGMRQGLRGWQCQHPSTYVPICPPPLESTSGPPPVHRLRSKSSDGEVRLLSWRVFLPRRSPATNHPWRTPGDLGWPLQPTGVGPSNHGAW